MLRQLRALIPRERPPKLRWQRAHCASDGIAHGGRAVPGEGRAVLRVGRAHAHRVSRHPRQVQEEREARGALDHRADGRTAQPQNQVAFPMPRHRAVVHLRRALADHQLRCHEPLAGGPRPRPGHAQRPSRAQAGGELAPQCAAPLDVERLIDRLVADAHRRIVGKIKRQAPRDLLRTPRPAPAPVLATAVPPALPCDGRPAHRCTIRRSDHPGQPLLHILPQPPVHRQHGELRTPRRTVRMPLGGGRAVVERAAAGRRVAAQLTRDRRRGALKLARNLAHAVLLRPQQREQLTLGEREIAPGQRRGRRSEVCRRHTARLPEPSCPDDPGHPRINNGRLRVAPARNRRPEPPPVFTAADWRSAR